MTTLESIVLLLLLACAPDLCTETADLPLGDALAIGDSVLAWSAPRCESVVDYAGLSSGEAITHRAVNGARMSGGDAPIPDQIPDGEWARVIMTGGGNDLNAAEACGAADPVPTLNRLVSEDGDSGLVPELLDGRLADSRVLLLGYYPLSPDGWYGLGLCVDEFEALNARLKRAADGRDRVEYLWLGQAIADFQGDPLAFDHVHPSPEAAELMGAAVAEALAAL